MLGAMEELNLLTKRRAPAPVLIVQFAAEYLSDYNQLGALLRREGIGAEVFPEAKKIGQQLQYAERRGFRVAVIAGSDEFAKGLVKIKDLGRREEHTVPRADLCSAVQKSLDALGT